MKKECSQIFISSLWTLVLMLFIPFIVAAQDASKTVDTPQKPTTTTVDAWRNALPEKERLTSPVDETASANVKAGEESFDQIEKRLNTLERRLMDAIKLHDAATLKRILADDFTLTSALSIGTGQDKTQYVEDVLRDWQLKSYNFDKLKVRVYGDTALVNAGYKQEAVVAGKESSGNFLLTDVWVKREGHWHVVSRHTSQVVSPR